ncbi:MAG: hypothetical protein JWN82_241 [Candidatus Saccharibacteria bacterium]|nr:hypothetical protein [Candidatus Saccharibacteria bacterium]
MSLATGAPTETLTPAVLTAGQVYMDYAIESAAHQQHPSSEISDNEFYRASLHLALVWKATRDTLGDPREDPLNQLALDALEDLPHRTTSQLFYRNVLLNAHELVTSRRQEVSPELKQRVYVHAAERALDMRNIVEESRRRPEHTPRLQRILGIACSTAVVNRHGFAMPAPAHQLLNNYVYTHGSVLLRRDDTRTLLGGGLRFDTQFDCAGYNDHQQGDRAAFTKGYSPSVRLLSAHCDLQLEGDDRGVDGVLDALEVDLDEGETPAKTIEQLDKLSDKLIRTLIWGKSRSGTRQPHRKRK